MILISKNDEMEPELKNIFSYGLNCNNKYWRTGEKKERKEGRKEAEYYIQNKNKNPDFLFWFFYWNNNTIYYKVQYLIWFCLFIKYKVIWIVTNKNRTTKNCISKIQYIITIFNSFDINKKYKKKSFDCVFWNLYITNASIINILMEIIFYLTKRLYFW